MPERLVRPSYLSSMTVVVNTLVATKDSVSQRSSHVSGLDSTTFESWSQVDVATRTFGAMPSGANQSYPLERALYEELSHLSIFG